MTIRREKIRNGRRPDKIRVPFSRPTITPQSIASYIRLAKVILKSGRLTLGEYTLEFERSIANFVGAKHTIAMNSCTSALFSIAMALGWRAGDEVLVPAVTFASTANAAILLGAKPVLVDSDYSSFNMSVEDTARRVTRGKTKAIVVVHLAGNPVDLRGMSEIAEDSGAMLVEDAAHALGSYYDGTHVGTFGAAGAFSFYPNKIITTGEGGCVTTEDDDLARKFALIRCVGREGLGPTDVLTFGANFRLSELQAALGLVLMKTVRSFLATRKRIAEYYDRELATMKDLVRTQIIEARSISSRYAYVVVLEGGIERDKVREQLLGRYGIETSILYVPLHMHPYYKQYGMSHENLPVADTIGSRSLALPIYGHMTKQQASYVVDSLRQTLGHLAK